MALALEHLPADVRPLADIARRALASSLDLRGLPLPRRSASIARPNERRDAEARASLADNLTTGLAPLSPPVAVLDALRSLAQPGCWAVVTGQQPGLCAAPLLTLYKALQAIALARELAAAWDTPVVPIFWNHGDDHDLAEANRLFVANENLDVEKLSLAGLSSGRQPLSTIVVEPLAHGLSAMEDRLRAMLARAPGANSQLALDLCLPRAGESLARAMTRTLTSLLGHHGLVVVEPDWMREDLSRALADLVSSGPGHSGPGLVAAARGPGSALPAALAAGSAALSEGGLDPSIDQGSAAILFRLEDGRRRALRFGGDGYRFDDEPGSRTPAELAAEIIQEPAAYSAGALLRPLVQDAVLPTAATVGGWGELAYQAQLGPARALAGLPPVPFIPRISITLTDPECRSSLEKAGLTAAEIIGGLDLSTNNKEEAAPAALALAEAADRLRVDLLSLRPALAELDPSLVAGLKRAADQARKSIQRLADKAARVADNQSGAGRRHRRRLAATLMPRGEPQERLTGPLPWLSRFGTAWLDELLAELDPCAPEHLLVHLSDDLAAGNDNPAP